MSLGGPAGYLNGPACARTLRTKRLATKQIYLYFRSLGGSRPPRPPGLGGENPPGSEKQYEIPAKGQLRLCYTIMLPGRKSGFPNRESLTISPPAGL